ncbi:GNAT family N-acetyltransferase [Enterococcus sp. BWT-B8]|uniref:GNAT family N-acetyltransferase n=1 Tax=Enterococcus sp. BWT-B8 TaxID=2885157 RepID=UPI001E656767|nr:GNAT family N-acetyltransferase [Enterococcus sp. BWT-B8]MCB5951050.1 GNAT family N-acetyltransferase [Enterococcus sp. BWT-B8]
MSIQLETERLELFEWSQETVTGLKSFLQNPEVMYAYEHGFSDDEVENWLKWNLKSYTENGYGLWGLRKKSSGMIIGECGLTNQKIEGETFLEIGYHLAKEYWHKGYAIEAAQRCKQYAFNELKAETVVSIIRDTNLASMKVAIRNGMLPQKYFIKTYRELEMPHYLFSVTKNNSYQE